MKFPEVGGGQRSANGQSLFLRMKSGDRVRGVFRGDPHIFKQHWIDGKSSVCPGKQNCEHCAAGDKAKFRFRINFLTLEEGVWMAKIFEQGYGTFKDLKAMHENDYDLETTLVTVTRQGEKTDTRYNILPCKDNLKPADFKKVAAIPLNSMSEKAEAAEPEAAPMSEDDIPF